MKFMPVRRARSSVARFRVATRALLLVAATLSAMLDARSAEAASPSLASADIVGTVTDSVANRPIGNAQVSITQGTRIVFNTSTDDFGRYRAHNLDAGSYTVSVHALGYRAQSRTVAVAVKPAPAVCAGIAATLTLEAAAALTVTGVMLTALPRVVKVMLRAASVRVILRL